MIEHSPAKFISGINTLNEYHCHARVVDSITPEAVDEIMIARYGRTRLEEPEVKDRSKHMLDEEGYGNWVYYPWRDEAIRFPEKDDFYAVRTSRNRQMITEEEQEVLRSKKVAHVGLSVGSNIALTSAQLGIGSEYVLIDPDTISLSNLNRIRANLGDVGLRKTEWVGRELSLIDPYIEQMRVDEEYTEETEEVMDAVGPDIIVEEVDDIRAKALLRRYAMSRAIPLVMVSDIGESSLIDIERHDMGPVKPFNGRVSAGMFEDLVNGRTDRAQEESLKAKIVGLRNVSPRLLESIMDPDLDGLPQLSTTVTVGAGLGAAAIAGIFLDRSKSSERFKVHQSKMLGLTPQQSLRSAVGTWRKFAARKRS